MFENMAETLYRPQMRPPGRPVSSDLRTPVAWRQREHNLNNNNHHHHLQQHQHPSPSPVSTTTDETSSEVETSVSGRRYNRLQSAAAIRYDRRNNTNTIRSTRSVPALNMHGNPWNAEPCPVHGHHLMHPVAPSPHLHPGFHRHAQLYSPYAHHGLGGGGGGGLMRKTGSMFDMRMIGTLPSNYHPKSSFYNPHPMAGFHGPPPPLPPSSIHAAGRTLEKKSHYGSLRSLHSLHVGVGNMGGVGVHPPSYHLPPMPPPHLLPPGMRPRPLVIPAGAEPLPVRDPTKSKTGGGNVLSGLGVNSKGGADVRERMRNKRSYHCCRGPLPLVWFIISIVTVGVVLGVVLGSIYG